MALTLVNFSRRTTNYVWSAMINSTPHSRRTDVYITSGRFRPIEKGANLNLATNKTKHLLWEIKNQLVTAPSLLVFE